MRFCLLHVPNFMLCYSLSKILSTLLMLVLFSYLQWGIYVTSLWEEIVASFERVNFKRIQSFASSLKSSMEFSFVSKFILYFSALGLIILKFWLILKSWIGSSMEFNPFDAIICFIYVFFWMERIGSWENNKKAALEAELKQIEVIRKQNICNVFKFYLYSM